MTNNNSQMTTAEIMAILGTEVGASINLNLAEKYKLNIGQLAEMTLLLNELFAQKMKLENLQNELQNRLGLTDEIATKLFFEICGRKLLAFDDYFSGKVEQTIAKAGGSIDFYSPLAQKFLIEAQKELTDKADAEALEKAEEQSFLEDQTAKSKVSEYVEEKFDENYFEFLKNVEDEQQRAKKFFSESIFDMISTDSYKLKLDLNFWLMGLLFEDEKEKKFQKDLLETLYKNQEKISEGKITVNGQTAEPTVANWLADFINNVEIEFAGSTIKRGQYLINSPNVKKLSAAEKRYLDILLKTFAGLKNFYENAAKMDLGDLTVCPYTEEDYEQLEEFIKKESQNIGESEMEDDNVDSENQQPIAKKEKIDLQKVSALDPVDRQKIEQEKKILLSATSGGEFLALADYFEEALLRRKRYPVLACLEVLCDTGTLDEIVFDDQRFSKLLEGYFLRNNLTEKKSAFAQNKREAEFIGYFLKFVFLERLGLKEDLGAKFAVNLSNILRSVGLAEYSMLAYFDLTDNKFKWS